MLLSKSHDEDHSSPQPVAGNTAETEPENRVRFPALDGLRGIAFLAVFLYHYGFFPFGWVGVECFFALSGFLITGILFDTLESPHRVRSFYTRRALRIFPLYYTVFLVLLLIARFDHGTHDVRWLLWPTYLANWLLFFHTGAIDPGTRSVIDGAFAFRHGKILHIGHFWSLCVEEQFYLVWPWVVFLVRKRKALLGICATVIVLTPVLRLLAFHVLSPAKLEAGAVAHTTVFRMDTLLFGAAAALLYRGSHRETLLTAARPVAWVAVALGVGLLAWTPAVFLSAHALRIVLIAGFSAIALLCTAVILRALTPASRLYGVLMLPPLRWVGRVSYGAYVFHDIPHAFYERFARGSKPLTALIGLVVTLVLAGLSYQFLESPFLRLKNRDWAR